VEVVASVSQGRTAAAQCGLFTHKSVPVIFEPPCTSRLKLFILRLLDAFTISVFAKDVTFTSRQCIEQSLYTANHIWQ